MSDVDEIRLAADTIRRGDLIRLRCSWYHYVARVLAITTLHPDGILFRIKHLTGEYRGVECYTGPLGIDKKLDPTEDILECLAYASE